MHVSFRLVLLFGRFLHEIFAHVIIIGEGEGLLHELVNDKARQLRDLLKMLDKYHGKILFIHFVTVFTQGSP